MCNCAFYQHEHEAVLHSLKTEYLSQLSQLNKQVHTLGQEVEKYRILAGIERLAQDANRDADAAASDIALPPPRKTLAAVATQSRQELTSFDSSIKSPECLSSTDLPVSPRTTVVSKSKLDTTDSTSEMLSVSSTSLDSFLPASECLTSEAGVAVGRSSVSSSSSVENTPLTLETDVFVSEANSAALLDPATLHHSPVKVPDTIPPPPPPPPLPSNLTGTSQNHPMIVFPPPAPPLPPIFGTPLGRPVVLRDGVPPPPPPPPPPVSGVTFSSPSGAWSLPGTPMTRRRSTPVPLSEMKPLFWKKIPNNELANIAASSTR